MTIHGFAADQLHWLLDIHGSQAPTGGAVIALWNIATLRNNLWHMPDLGRGGPPDGAGTL